MKAFNSIVSIILLIAVAFLLVREFLDDKPARKAASEEEFSANIEEQEFTGVRIAYVNNDSLVEKYDYHQDLKAGLESKVKGLEIDLEKKRQAFQENYELLEEKAPGMSEAQLREAQADLQMKQQQFMQYRDQRAQELSLAEQQLGELIFGDLDTVLAEVREDLDLDFILSYDRGTAVLQASDSYDITDIVAKRLNERYAAKNQEEETSETEE